MTFYGLVLGILATWRLTHLFVYEDGPFDLFFRLRRLAGEGFFGKLLDCFYCTSIWAAAPLAILIGERWAERLLLWLALSAGAIFMQKALERLEAPKVPPAIYYEEPEKTDELLRKEP